MPNNTTLYRVDPGDPARSILEAEAKAGSQGEGSGLLLDFSGVQRLDAAAVGALQRVSASAAGRQVTLTARAVPVRIYKVLKLAGVTERMSFI
jgi:anti-anti-sigma regulatory factor